MLKTAIRGLQAHKLRFALTALSIVMGVAFVAGSFVFTDTISARFDSLFSDLYAGIDASVTVDDEVSTEVSFEASVLDEIRALPSVSKAEGSAGGFAQIIGNDGEPIGGIGATPLGVSWVDDPALNVLRVEDGRGRAPEGAGEVVIDVATAEANGFEVGSTVEVLTLDGVEEFTLVGIASFGEEDNLAGANLAAFELTEAQRIFDLEDRYTSIDVIAADGVEQQEVVEEIQATLPAGLRAVSGDQQIQEQLDGVKEGLGFLNVALLTFAGISVFVGAFVIQNTFRITIAQRVRELGLLRALGATSRQITRLVLVEAAVLSLVGSVVGVLAGIGIAETIKAGLNGFGLGVPDGPLTLEPRTVAVAFAVGFIVTLGSAWLPSRKAASIPPIAALSSADQRPKPKSLRTRALVGSALTIVGIASILFGLFMENGSSLYLVAGGAVAVFFGVSTLAPLLVGPMVKVLATPFRGVAAKLALDNTKRRPRRTASTASALMIGVTLVAFVSVFAATIKTSISDTMNGSLPADLIVNTGFTDLPISDSAVEAVEATEEVEVASQIHLGWYSIEGVELDVAGVDPDTVTPVYDADATIDLADIGDGMLVLDSTLEESGWAVGDVVDVEYPTKTVPTEIVGSFANGLFASTLISQEVYEDEFGQMGSSVVNVQLVDGVGIEDGKAAVEEALTDFPNLAVDTKSETIAGAEAQIDGLVGFFNGLLGLALVIALLGIANTLALTIIERVREIGLLRAVGMERRQIRSMIRIESSITAVFGALMGIVMGVGLGYAVIASMADEGLGSLSLPVTQLAIWLVLAGLAGVVAAMGPARRASKLDILTAIGEE